MKQKSSILAAALTGLLGQQAEAKSEKKQPPPKPQKPQLTDTYVAIPSDDRPMGPLEGEELCYGIQNCKSFTFCGILPEDIAAANKAFNNKFKNSTPHHCSKMGTCAASKGVLGYTYTKIGTCITKHGGFYIVRDPKTNAPIVKKK